MDVDQFQKAVDLGREMILLTLVISLPLLVVGLVVGLGISVLQAATQVQEQTLAFIPKIVAVAFAMFLLLPWLMTRMTEYTVRLFTEMPGLFR
ncbi:MAG: flagellar biosynthesis protein FliQ [Planctomycetes bacterium]|nr:flagellar biosynthesis protein FliQ [Planctomycetota bacterium]